MAFCPVDMCWFRHLGCFSCWLILIKIYSGCFFFPVGINWIRYLGCFALLVCTDLDTLGVLFCLPVMVRHPRCIVLFACMHRLKQALRVLCGVVCMDGFRHLGFTSKVFFALFWSFRLFRRGSMHVLMWLLKRITVSSMLQLMWVYYCLCHYVFFVCVFFVVVRASQVSKQICMHGDTWTERYAICRQRQTGRQTYLQTDRCMHAHVHAQTQAHEKSDFHKCDLLMNLSVADWYFSSIHQ